MTKDEAEALKMKIDRGYHDRDDYPPFALDSMEDRIRYGAYVFKIIDEMVKDEGHG